MELNTIYNEDCLEGIGRIPTGSIQTVICDPPYAQGLTQNGQRGVFKDLVISKPFFDALFGEIGRVMTDTGCVYWFCDWRGYAFYYPIMLNRLPVRNMIVWDKAAGGGNFYTFEHELIIFSTNNLKFACKGARNIIRGISSFGSGAKKTNGEKVHPTQKPVELIARLITDSTAEGDTVLDCFMGSGTTAVAAIRTGRQYVGFEIDENYHALALRRVEQEQRQLKLAL